MDFIVTDKPAGLNTHGSERNQMGWVEYQSQQQGAQLWVVHRLDKGTHGVLILAKSAESAAYFFNLFKDHRIEKTYRFITHHQSVTDTITVKGCISKSKDGYSFTPDADGDTETHFFRVKRTPFFEVWQAHPKSGKTHQIRLHAAYAGLPLLGDPIYGGQVFPTLCLHAFELQWDTTHFQAPLPLYFERPGLLKYPLLVTLLSALDQRQRIFQFLSHPLQTLRAFSLKLNNSLLIGEVLGPILWVHDYDPAPTVSRELEETLERLAEILGRQLIIQKRHNRGAKDALAAELYEHRSAPPKNLQWTACEKDLKFEFRAQQGFSTGLFLDQRLNRHRLRQMAHNKRVLNLFCYTCGFTVAALKGGAKQVVNVDLSGAYLDWGRRNLQLNDLDPESCLWFKSNALDWLQRAQNKEQWRFDIIVCDPPTFGRHSKGTFRLENSYLELVQQCLQLLKPEGQLLFSCNIEHLSAEVLLNQLSLSFPNWSLQSGPVDLDFLLGDPHGLSKTFWFQKSV